MVVNGYGSYGIVVSTPRIPVNDEDYLDMINLDEVSKILYISKTNSQKYLYYEPSDYIDFVSEYININILISKYNNVFVDTYFMLPLNGGIIDKNRFVFKFKENKDYGYKWLSDSEKYFKIFNSLISSSKNLYQITYKKGYRIDLDINNFVIKMENIYDGIILLNRNNFFLDDIKYENLIFHDNKIKMIDFSEPINMNGDINDYTNSIINGKLSNLFYFPYNIIPNLLIYQYIDKVQIINFCHSKLNEYLILQINSLEYIENVNFKLNILNKLNILSLTYLSNYKITLKVINSDYITNNITNIEEKYEYINISIEQIINSMKVFLIYSNSNSIKKNTIINTIQLYKKFIDYICNNDNKESILLLLRNSNMYSYGMLYVEWLNKNKKYIYNNEEFIINFKKILNIIGICCSNILFFENKIFFGNYSMNDIKEYMN